MKRNYYKILVLFILFLLSFSYKTYSQVKPDTFLVKAKVDFAVPDAPAFKILGTDPASVLRPSSTRDVAVTIANLFQGSKIPDNFSIELSPGLIFGKSLSKYRENPFFYRARFSFATKSTENSKRQIGTGIRLTLLDNTDLRMDNVLMESLINQGKKRDQLKGECEKELIDKKIDEMDPNFLMLLDKCIAEKEKSQKFSEIIDSLRSVAKLKRWNAAIIELGIAASAFSNDSLYSDIAIDSYRWWLSGAFPLGEDGQIITGVNGGITKNDNGELKNTESNFGLRAYYGTNYHKLFLEGSLRTASSFTPMITFNIGYEYNLSNGIWADLSIGIIKKESNKFSSTSSLNLRLATPE